MQSRIVASISVAAALLVAWVAVGPFVAAHAIRDAVIRNDVVALDEHIDFPAVRDSLKGQLFGLVDPQGAPGAENNGSGFANALKMVVGTALDVMLTPQGVLELLRHKTALGQDSHNDGGESSQQNSSSPARRKPVIHYGFVSPNRFDVTVADAEVPDLPATLELRRYGLEWKLAAIELPLNSHPAAP